MKRMLLLSCILNIICLLSITWSLFMQQSRVIEQVQKILAGSEVRSCAGSEFNEAEAVKSRNFSAAINQ